MYLYIPLVSQETKSRDKSTVVIIQRVNKLFLTFKRQSIL
jgi:hypothetical protein